jgi:hypothetical protein
MRIDRDKVREDAIQSLKENSPEFVWKSRIVDAVNKKILALHQFNQRFGITDRSKIDRLDKSISHLEAWIEDCIEEEMEAIIEDNTDPYTLRGLRRSDFY